MNSDVVSKLILDEIEDVVYISDPVSHELYYINGQLQRDLGNISEEQWRRKKCYEILQGKTEPCDFCTNHLLCHEKFHSWEHYNQIIDDHFLIQDKLVNFEGIEARLEIAKNVTKQKQLEQDLKRRLAEQQALNDCIALLHTNESPDASIQKLLGLVANYHHAERGYIFLLGEDNSVVNNSHEWCAEGVIPQIEFLQNIPAEIVAHWFAKYRQVGEFYIDSLTEDVSPDTEEYRILEEQGIQSLITAPLYNVDGSFKGFLGVDNPKEKTKETMVIRAVSNFVADFLEKNEHMLKLYEVSYFDSLVGMRNRHSYRGMLERLEGVQLNTLGVVFVDINGLKVVNDNYGHKQGDAYIKKVGGLLKELYGDDAFRIGGDEFVVMFTDKSKAGFETKLEQLKAFIARDEFPSAAIGVSWRDENCSLGAQIEIADRLMYKHKAEQYRKYAGKSELFKLKYHEESDN